MTRKLSSREREVYDLYFSCNTREEIAILLGISVKTVDSYLDKCRNKFGLTSYASLRTEEYVDA